MSSRTRTLFRGVLALALVGLSTTAFAQIQVNTTPANPGGVFQAFPAQNPLGPTGVANQTNYPYPGQCLADPASAAMFPLLGLQPACAGGSFAPFQRTAGSWADQTGTVRPFRILNPVSPAAQTKFLWPVLNPPDYSPDKASFPGADYYEIGVHEAWGFNALAKAGLFPNPGPGVNVPDGMQWTGLTCDNVAGCSCPADASAAFVTAFCTAGGKIPQGAPLFTPIWGIGQVNNAGGPVTVALRDILGTCSVSGTLCQVGATPFPGAVAACPLGETCNPFFTNGTPSAWSNNNYVSTWPSISIRGEKGRPVVVKWVNEFPNTHVLCPHPEAADWPCAIDRTFMGVKTRIDPGLPHTSAVPPEKVNRYGSPQQPDNSWVTHLHGGEIPPSTDGFASKWFGNAVTAAAYANTSLNPPFESNLDRILSRPAGNSDTYTYPMVNDEATIWFHDHTLGKTHHNVIAGPAGFFPVRDSKKHGGLGAGAGTCPAAAGGTCTTEYTWLDPVTQPRNDLGVPLYDMFLALQDRSFNDDGSINFSNGLGQAFLAPDPLLPVGYSSITPGVNPQVHPTWVPEYFGDHVLVNGVLWPRAPVAAGWYRLRLVAGSDSRCWSLGFSFTNPAPGTVPVYNQWFFVIANDQGYLPAPVVANWVSICPGERIELLVNFEGRPNQSVWMVNNAPAPFPAGVGPATPGSPYGDMNVVMRFDVGPTGGTPALPAVRSCAKGVTTNWNATWGDGLNGGNAAMLTAISGKSACMEYPGGKTDPNFVKLPPTIPAGGVPAIPFPAGSIVRQVYLNERLDGVTGAPFGMQLNGVPFEYKVTETPKKGSREYWQFINLTVDTHPMHPHFVKHQIVARQGLYVTKFKQALCGHPACQPGPVPGGEAQVVPDVTPFLALSNAIPPSAWEAGWKDASKAPPNAVTTIVADWIPNWAATGPPNAPGTAGCPNGTLGCPAPYVYEDVTTGPYVWHCHINSHEDSEMMRTSLVVP